MKQYLELARKVIEEGYYEQNRTGVATTQIFGTQARFDLTDNKIAAVTTKKIHHKSVIHELLWMIAGDTNVKYLQENGVRIWNEWADADGELGPVYGAQWRKWTTFKKKGMGHHKIVVDQLADVIQKLRAAPQDRRIILSAWNVGDLPDMNLPPCHMMFQVDSEPASEEGGKRKLRLQMYQRSVDVFLGLPFNLEFYSILAHMLAHITNHEAVELIHVGGNVHIYENHMKQIKTQIKRKPKASATLTLNPDIKEIDDFTFDDITIEGYTSHAALTGKVAV
ncbi:thymidylate synthase [Vibrio maritimus]|uniref:Thymidylate synthase n=1 Tax=Vibrio maritimus TaxID=990268 RepID=A0A090SUM3_9VIBR|nr:thymidylate synthase [Vibrio maritimus]